MGVPVQYPSEYHDIVKNCLMLYYDPFQLLNSLFMARCYTHLSQQGVDTNQILFKGEHHVVVVVYFSFGAKFKNIQTHCLHLYYNMPELAKFVFALIFVTAF